MGWREEVTHADSDEFLCKSNYIFSKFVIRSSFFATRFFDRARDALSDGTRNPYAPSKGYLNQHFARLLDRHDRGRSHKGTAISVKWTQTRPPW